MVLQITCQSSSIVFIIFRRAIALQTHVCEVHSSSPIQTISARRFLHVSWPRVTGVNNKIVTNIYYSIRPSSSSKAPFDVVMRRTMRFAADDYGDDNGRRRGRDISAEKVWRAHFPRG